MIVCFPCVNPVGGVIFVPDVKGWYKGKEKPDKLNEITRTNRNISYPVTYDDQDDITIVYDEFKTEDKFIPAF
jgi:hypothetical protein